MRTSFGFLTLVTAVIFSAPSRAIGEEPAGTGARINNLKVLSSKIDDVTTEENILKSFVKPGMSDQDRAKALWTAAVRYRYQTAPPNEYLAADWEAHDPVKLFNVYGYCMCCCSSALIEALNRLDGRQARGRILNNHSVPEVAYGGGWHMFDASLLTFFPKPKDNVAASVDEIAGAISSWYASHPEYKGNRQKLDQLMRSEQWNGWKRGPRLLAQCPYYDRGFLPARTHGWNDTMQEYDRRCEVYEYGYQVGHRALFSLRPGEAYVREAGNRGLHVNRPEMPSWDALSGKAPGADLVYLKQFLPGYNGGVVGNGYHRYHPDLARGGLAAGAEVYDNLAAGGAPALHLRTPGRPGTAVISLTSPYVYLGGRVTLKAVRKSSGDRVVLSLSTNNARTFLPLWTADKIGAQEAVIDLGDRIARRYACWLKIDIESDTIDGTGLDDLAIENDIQHAPRTMPWLGKGSNTITVAADGNPAVASRAITCRITPDASFSKNETTASMGVVFENLKVDDGSCWWQNGVGAMTVPIEMPGEIRALRYGAQVRVRGKNDRVRMLVSFDDGQKWTEASRITGPTAGTTQYFRWNRVPAGTRKALLRYELSGDNTIGILSFRIDADYKDPRADGEFRPFNVVHRWNENGQPKSHTARITSLPFSYPIITSATPDMVSVTYEMPPSAKTSRQ